MKKLEEKGFFEFYEAVISRLESFEDDTDGNFELSELQKQAFNEINKVFETKEFAFQDLEPYELKPIVFPFSRTP
jgi:hypothetical protein